MTQAPATTAAPRPVWDSEEWKAADRRRQQAVGALYAGAEHCPSRLDAAAFGRYQRETMQPLRDALAAAADTARATARRLQAAAS